MRGAVGEVGCPGDDRRVRPGGSAARLGPLIVPGASFEARFPPPRAGTFIYHTHMDKVNQRLAGLAGPLIVLEPGARYDASTDLSVLVTSPRDTLLERRAVLLNGSTSPEPLTLYAGTVYRVRIVNITTRRPGLRVELPSRRGRPAASGFSASYRCACCRRAPARRRRARPVSRQRWIV